MLEWTCQQARHVVTPTATVAAQLAERIPLSGRPVPIPLGIDHLAISAADDAGTVPGVEAALVHLSMHEEFGLTPLEAMACGSRVIASDIPVLRETLGSHAGLVEPGSTASS